MYLYPGHLSDLISVQWDVVDIEAHKLAKVQRYICGVTGIKLGWGQGGAGRAFFLLAVNVIL